MTQTDEIRRAFCPEGRQPIVAIDAEDIEAMIAGGQDVSFITLTGDSVDALVCQLKAAPLLPAARKILFELIVAPGYEFPFTDLAPLSDCLAALPNHPEIVWGGSRAAAQSQNLKLNILLTSQKHEN